MPALDGQEAARAQLGLRTAHLLVDPVGVVACRPNLGTVTVVEPPRSYFSESWQYCNSHLSIGMTLTMLNG
jgi:hypothetical protein